jgi:putative addiction module component (TIGR02574 family)
MNQISNKSGGAMSLSLLEIEREVVQLTPEERERLIGFLIATLEPTEEDDVETAWKEEVLARSKDIHEGRVISVPADEALARVRRSLRSHPAF